MRLVDDALPHSDEWVELLSNICYNIAGNTNGQASPTPPTLG